MYRKVLKFSTEIVVFVLWLNLTCGYSYDFHIEGEVLLPLCGLEVETGNQNSGLYFLNVFILMVASTGPKRQFLKILTVAQQLTITSPNLKLHLTPVIIDVKQTFILYWHFLSSLVNTFLSNDHSQAKRWNFVEHICNNLTLCGKNHLVRVFIAVKINSFGYFRMKLQEMNFLWCLSLIMVKVGKSATQAPHLEDDHSHTRFRRSQSRSRSPR